MKTKNAYSLLALLLFLFSFNSQARTSDAVATRGFAKTPSVNPDRYRIQAEHSLNYLLRNIDSPGVMPGVVVASPSKKDPDYFYHWVRDAALAMESLRLVAERTSDPVTRSLLIKRLKQWVAFEHHLQLTSDLGEPKYLVTGVAYPGPWGRPQDDGPAARAITMIRLANTLIEDGELEWVKNHLYSGGLPPNSPIKLDLEYIARVWPRTSFDVWEEVKGHHFYTRLLQRSALRQGAQLARRLQDFGAAEHYDSEASRLEAEISAHVNPKKALIEPTRNQDDGWTHKNESLDVAVILGVIQAANQDGYFNATNEWVLGTAEKLSRRFQDIYPVNHHSPLATSIGRYPEDVYDGTGFSGGNPWFLATHAYAELYCLGAKEIQAQLAHSEKDSRRLSATKRSQLLRLMKTLETNGRSYLDRSIYHVDSYGQMSEQFSRYNGYQRAAPDLSWSYASYLTAYFACF